ncbi:MAG: polysaccharide biosynthesis/export family protein [Roseibacillus sp.]
MFTVLLGSVVAQVEAPNAGMSGLISSSDTVSVSVHREPDLNTNVQLAKDGSITIPLIGSVSLAGKTTSSAETLIEKKLLDGYLVRPEVTVRITKRQIHTVSVDGEVNRPGVFTLPHGQSLTLRQVISMAGGANDVANLKKITLTSGSTGKAQFINLKDIISGKKNDIVLKKDDFIWVPEGFF